MNDYFIKDPPKSYINTIIEGYKKDFVIAIEMTDALNRGSSGSAQRQRFHHVLGPALMGHLGIYYLRKGRHKIRPDLFGMAAKLSEKEKGSYFITDDLKILNKILEMYGTDKFFSFLLKNL